MKNSSFPDFRHESRIENLGETQTTREPVVDPVSNRTCLKHHKHRKKRPVIGAFDEILTITLILDVVAWQDSIKKLYITR